MPGDAPRAERPGYALVDAGDGRRLERFGPRLVDRPAPVATETRRAPEAWAGADLRFDPDLGWTAPDRTPPEASVLAPWTVSIDGLVLELRPTSSGGVGQYPEQVGNVAWLADRVRAGVDAGHPPTVLNLFAHTGLLTLAAARAGASVAHVDGAPSAVAWARRNAELSGLADRPIRWLVDDATAFVAREGRRRRRYDGIVLDPPSYGHAKGRRWRLEDELPNLLAECGAVATDDAFVLLTAHTTGLDDELAAMVAAVFAGEGRAEISRLRLEAESRAVLDLGWSVRLTR
jgi:23S rRNA (cytosine1962-C5)-methyltransferase